MARNNYNSVKCYHGNFFPKIFFFVLVPWFLYDLNLAPTKNGQLIFIFFFHLTPENYTVD